MYSRRGFIKSVVAAGTAAAVFELTREAKAALPAVTQLPTKGAVVDWSSYWISPRTLAILRSRTSAPRVVSETADAVVIETASGLRQFYPTASLDIEKRSRAVANAGISRQVLTFPSSLGIDAALSPSEAREFWTAYNDDLSAVVKSNPSRWTGLAGVTTADPAWSATEVERAVGKLGLLGVSLSSAALETLAGAEKLRPVFAAADKWRAHVNVQAGHASGALPGYTAVAPREDDAPELRSLFDAGESLALAAITLAHTGFLDSFPAVTIQLSQLGGGTPLLASLLALYDSRDNLGDGLGQLRKLYYDTAEVGGSGHIPEFAVATLGSERLLFGSGYPETPIREVWDGVGKSSIPEPDKRGILFANGVTLIASKTATLAG
ncbi:MAG TPA: amidohydrolase family protein [Capsulimonadaceae bacterium]|jgi:predicted TIM-barrel fold metal-dependent hydrolase